MNIITYSIRSLLRGAFVYTFIRGMFAVGGDIADARKEKRRAKERRQKQDQT